MSRPDDITLRAISDEVVRARSLFPPGKNPNLVALVEEVGEVAQALLEGRHADAREEAIQVAAMAIRIIEEGDRTVRQQKGPPPRPRCPHDGGTCHHACANERVCFREANGMAFSTPHLGYPKEGHG